MKALPLWQPWASLVAVGAKRVETRHWPAPHWVLGQRVAIHATKTTREVWIAQEQPFQRCLQAAAANGRLTLVDDGLPFGAIVATAIIDRCSIMTQESIAALRERDPDEHAFGLYEPGRYAWVLRDPEPLATPVPFKGAQGIFDVPDELLGRVPAQGRLLP